MYAYASPSTVAHHDSPTHSSCNRTRASPMHRAPRAPRRVTLGFHVERRVWTSAASCSTVRTARRRQHEHAKTDASLGCSHMLPHGRGGELCASLGCVCMHVYNSHSQCAGRRLVTLRHCAGQIGPIPKTDIRASFGCERLNCFCGYCIAEAAYMHATVMQFRATTNRYISS